MFTKLMTTLALASMTFGAALADAPKIKSVDGVASYPAGYQGTPHRKPSEDPFLSPTNSALILIDYQPHILMGIKSIDHKELMNNTIGLIRTAVIYDIPIIFSHVGVGLKGSAPFLKELTKWAPNARIIDRTNVNAWEEPEFVAAVKALGRKKLIMGGLWTDVCLAYPAIEAAKAGYLRYTFTPAGDTEAMFRAFFDAAQSDELVPERMAEIAARYDQEFVGPTL